MSRSTSCLPSSLSCASSGAALRISTWRPLFRASACGLNPCAPRSPRANDLAGVLWVPNALGVRERFGILRSPFHPALCHRRSGNAPPAKRTAQRHGLGNHRYRRHTCRRRPRAPLCAARRCACADDAGARIGAGGSTYRNFLLACLFSILRHVFSECVGGYA